MNHLVIKSMEVALPKNTVHFENARETVTRYRVSEGETALTLMCEATKKALEQGNFNLADLDLIVVCSAVPLQLIPCGATIFQNKMCEILGEDTMIPSFDVNSTCSSFLTALDTVSYFLESGRYHRILIVACDTGSLALNENQRESYELFSDAAVATIVEGTKEEKGILAAHMLTDPRGITATQISGGGSLLPPYQYTKENHEAYLFDMNGPQTLRITKKAIDIFIPQLLEKVNLTKDDFDYIIPHQASLALKLIVKHLKLNPDKTLDLVKDYGNMVTASVPFGLQYAIQHKLVKEGDTIFLLGTAAGISINGIILKL